MADKKAKMIKLPEPLEDDDWKVKEDFRTLVEAKKICKDKARHDKVIAYAMQAKQNANDVIKDLIEEKAEYGE